jgi:hypothetical protein
VFTTWLNFSGIWLLATLSFLVAEPQFGAAVFLAYWFGRALSVWIAPLLLESAVATPRLLAQLQRERPLFGLVHGAGLIWSVVVVGWWVGSGTAI